MKHYSYRRVSTTTQEKNGYGLETQQNEINAYCAANGIELHGSYTDAGISGTEINRAGLNELLAVLEQGDCVVVLNTSRLWRSDTVKVIVQRELKKLGVQIISVEQPTYDMYTTDPNDFLFNGMTELLDQYERLHIAMKLAKGRKTKARGGSKACGTAPFGYKWENAEIVIDYNNNLIVKDIFDMYATTRSSTEVARLCRVKGYKTSTGKDFTKQAIFNIVQNDFYAGVVTHAGEKTIGTHPEIISPEMFRVANPGWKLDGQA